jgi:hypothetical protein
MHTTSSDTGRAKTFDAPTQFAGVKLLELCLLVVIPKRSVTVEIVHMERSQNAAVDHGFGFSDSVKHGTEPA